MTLLEATTPLMQQDLPGWLQVILGGAGAGGVLLAGQGWATKFLVKVLEPLIESVVNKVITSMEEKSEAQTLRIERGLLELRQTISDRLPQKEEVSQ